MMNSLRTARIVTAIYGLVALVGGTIGFIKAGSVASLVAGGLSGLILIGAAALAGNKPKPGLIVALVTSLLLVGRFGSAAARAGVSPVALVMIIGGVAVVVVSAMALAAKPSRA
jgi:uncharacterized membrane protein (UPF0136 family)